MLYLPTNLFGGEYFTIKYSRNTLFEITCKRTGKILKQGEYVIFKYEPHAEEGGRVSILAKEYIPREVRAPGVFQAKEVTLIPNKVDNESLQGYFFGKDLQLFDYLDIPLLDIEIQIESLPLFTQGGSLKN